MSRVEAVTVIGGFAIIGVIGLWLFLSLIWGRPAPTPRALEHQLEFDVAALEQLAGIHVTEKGLSAIIAATETGAETVRELHRIERQPHWREPEWHPFPEHPFDHASREPMIWGRG